MKIEIREDEYYPVLIPEVVRPRKRRRVYEIDYILYKKWMKVFKDFHNTQKEIEKMVEKADRKRRISICGF